MCPLCNVILEYHSKEYKEGGGKIHIDDWYTCPECNGMYEIEEVEGYGHGV